LAPNTTFTVNFNEKGITGTLASGMITVLGASNNVGVKMADGNTVELTAGESATANGKTYDKDANKAGKSGGAAWWAWAAIFGGAAVGVIWAATSGNGLQLGGTATVASPSR